LLIVPSYQSLSSSFQHGVAAGAGVAKTASDAHAATSNAKRRL